MMVDYSSHLAGKVVLIRIQNVVIDQSHVCDGVGGWELRTELVVEVQLVLTDLAVLEVLNDF